MSHDHNHITKRQARPSKLCVHRKMASEDIATAYSFLQNLTLKETPLFHEELGVGAYGKVFAVQYRGTRYAAKMIHQALIDAAGSREEKEKIERNFLRECYYYSKLSHPNIVAFKGVYGYSDKKLFLPMMVMELMEDSLTKYVKRQVLNMETKISVLYDVSCGLNYLHRYKPEPIIHCDLSPNNILLMSRHRQKVVAKISDLGVAKIVKADSKATKSKLTTAPGTLDFMPPEAMVKNPQYDTSLDIFSYAGIVLHVINQKWPAPCEPVLRNPNNNKPIAALSEVERRQKWLDKMSGTGKVLEPLVVACLNDDPAKRPATATVLRILELLFVSFMYSSVIVYIDSRVGVITFKK